MKASMWTNYYWDLHIVDAVKRIGDAGFRYVELASPIPFVDGTYDKKDTNDLLEVCDQHGITMHQIHGYWGEYLQQGSRQWKERTELFNKEITASHALGVTSLVAHPMGYPRQEDGEPVAPTIDLNDHVMENNIAFFGQFIPDLEKTGMKIAIENVNYPSYMQAEELIRIIEGVGSPLIAICVDTSHLALNKMNMPRFITTAGKHIAATHISESHEGLDLHLFPLFCHNDGMWIDWISVRDAFEYINYDRPFNLEVPGEARAPLEIRDQKLQYFFTAISSYLAGE